jgi:uncharacterized protein
MKTESNAKLLTIYVNSTDQYHGQPLYAAIVQTCRERKIAGATVFRSMEGFGSSGRLHTARLLELSENLPVRIEIIDRAEQIDALVPILDTMIGEGLVTLSDVHILRYRPGRSSTA